MAMPQLDSRPSRSTLLADPGLRNALLRFVRARVPATEAEDIVQATLTDALASSTAPENAEELRRWIHGIARNKVVDFHRRAGREVPRELPPGDEPTADSAPHSARDLLRWAENELPDGAEAKSTLEWMLREGDGEKLEHIAEEARLPAPRVRQRVSRMRRHLRARWAAAVAAVAVLALVAFALWRMARPGPDDIAREMLPPVTPEQRAAELRRQAFELCDDSHWQRCVEALDSARALDPAGDQAERVQRARSAAGRALAPLPEPAPSQEPEPNEDVAPKNEDTKTPRKAPPAPTFVPPPTKASEPEQIDSNQLPTKEAVPPAPQQLDSSPLPTRKQPQKTAPKPAPTFQGKWQGSTKSKK